MSLLHLLAPALFEDTQLKEKQLAQANEEYYTSCLDQYVTQFVAIYEAQCSNLSDERKHIKAQAHTEYMMICNSIQKYMKLLNKEYHNFVDEYMLHYDSEADLLYIKDMRQIKVDILEKTA